MKYEKLSIIIPVYNEEKYIAQTILAVKDADSCGLDKEIIIVDDGSTDNTSSKIKDQSSKVKSNPKVQIQTITKKINEGKGAALKAGFLRSTGDIVIVQDADLEYNPNEYPLLLRPFLDHDADVVYGSRFISNHPHRVLYYWHSIGNTILTAFSNILTNLNFTDMETGYKVFRGDLIRNIAKKLQNKRFGFEPEITAKIARIPAIRIYEVGISYWGRTYKEGKKINWIDGLKAIYEIIKFNLFSV